MSTPAHPQTPLTPRRVLPAAGIAVAAGLFGLVPLLLPAHPDREVASGDGAQSAAARALACPSAPRGSSGASVLSAAGAGAVTTTPAAVGEASEPVVLPAGKEQAAGGLWLRDVPRVGVSWWGACQPAAPEQVVQVTDPARARLLLVNPGTVDGLVDITLHGEKGELSAVGTSSITVPARGQRAVPLSVQAPAGKPVGARIIATQGRVAAWALADGPEGADHIPGGALRTGLVIPAVPAGGRSTLLLTNPGAEAATVTVRAHGSRGGFEPTGAGRLVVEPGSTLRTDVSRSFAGESGALSVVSDHPVAASVDSVVGKDLAAMTGQRPTTSGLLVGPGGGHALFTNASDANVPVRLVVDGKQAEHTIGAGAVVSVPMPATAGSIAWSAQGPLVAGAVLDDGALALVPGQETGATRSTQPPRQDQSLR